LAPITKMEEVDQPEAEILGRAAELDDLAEPLLHLRGQALDAVSVGAPGSAVEDASAGQCDPLLLGLQPLSRLARLGVRRHHVLHEPRARRAQRLHLADPALALTHARAPHR